jgi:heme-degrading monooxygenase HmoA
MHARVSTYSFDPSRADELVSGFEQGIGAIEDEEGMEGAYLLVDRASGKAITMTLWASEDALTASAPSADQARSSAAGGAGASIDSVDGYEVALQRTRSTQMSR